MELYWIAIQALNILLKVPAAASAAKNLGFDFGRFKQGQERGVAFHPDPDSPLGRMLDGELKKMDDLVRRYHVIDTDAKYGELEKNEHRRRIAAQFCQLLDSIKPLRPQIENYDILHELFCTSILDALK